MTRRAASGAARARLTVRETRHVGVYCYSASTSAGCGTSWSLAKGGYPAGSLNKKGAR